MTAVAVDPLIEVEDLRFAYPGGGFDLVVPALAIARGERVAFVGPSGSGKSTLLALIAGILVASEGRVVVGGQDWGRLGDAARRRFRITRVGLVFQEFELLDHLSVEENILLPYYVNHALRRDADTAARLDQLTEATGIARLRRRRPRALSQGERQRVAICRALITRPALVLADEPTGNLDYVATGKVLDLLLAETARADATLVMVTHDRSLIDRFDRVVDFGELSA